MGPGGSSTQKLPGVWYFDVFGTGFLVFTPFSFAIVLFQIPIIWLETKAFRDRFQEDPGLWWMGTLEILQPGQIAWAFWFSVPNPDGIGTLGYCFRIFFFQSLGGEVNWIWGSFNLFWSCLYISGQEQVHPPKRFRAGWASACDLWTQWRRWGQKSIAQPPMVAGVPWLNLILHLQFFPISVFIFYCLDCKVWSWF